MQQSAPLHACARTEDKKELLAVIYGVYARWIERFPLACHKGCAACCTQSVTMTSLEGGTILDFVKNRGLEEWMREKLSRAAPGKSKTGITTNQFAGACLNRQEVDGDVPGGWNFSPCIFLEENACSIYEARPFGCRSFGSLRRCAADSAAEMVPMQLAVNTVFTQVIEHMNSDGGYWAAMADILTSLVDSRRLRKEARLLPALPVPGFLLEPHEVKVVRHLMLELYEESGRRKTLGDLIDNFMSI